MHHAKSTPTTVWMRRSACALLIGQALAAPGHARAAGNDAELRELKTMIEALQHKIATLEQAQQASAAAASAPAAAAAPAGNLLPGGLKLYGSLDSGVERVTGVGASGKTLTRVPSTTGSGPSVVGLDFRGRLNDGVAAIGKAEMGLYLDTGSSGQGSRLFGRQLYVGVDTPYGSLTVGRQYSMLFYSLHGADILGPNIHGLGSIDAYIPNARADNALVWRAKFDQLTLGAHYSFGRDTVSGTVPASGVCGGEDATDPSRCRGWSAMARYDAPRFGLAVAIDTQHGGNGAQAAFFNGSAPIVMSDDGDQDRRITANGYVRFGGLKLGAGWLGRKVDTAATGVEQDVTWLAAEYALSPKWLVDGSVFQVDNDDQGRSATLYAARATYRFDEQLSAYLSLGYIDNSSDAAYGVSGGGAGAAPAAGKSQLGTMAGVRYRF